MVNPQHRLLAQLGDPLPQRVAILRALQLGDLLCAIPAIRALRAALPRAEITLIGLPWAKAFVDRFDRYFDAFLEFPGYPGLPERDPIQFQQIPQFLKTAQKHHFDLAIQMHGSGTLTNPLTMLLGAERNTGFFVPGAYCPDPDRFFPYLEQEPEVCRHLHLMEFLGIPIQGTDLEFPLQDQDWKDLAAIAEIETLHPQSYICIHPGSRSPWRRWSPEQFARVADELANQGLTIVLTGSTEEVSLTSAVAASMRSPVMDLAGRTTLGALAALLSRARLLVCNDTGISHIAVALKIPSVVIFTGSSPQRWAPLNRDRHRVVAAITGNAITKVIHQANALLQISTSTEPDLPNYTRVSL